jgi:hypothetical protein
MNKKAHSVGQFSQYANLRPTLGLLMGREREMFSSSKPWGKKRRVIAGWLAIGK